MAAKRPQLRIDANDEIVTMTKSVAYRKGTTQNEFVLNLIATYGGNKELKKLIETYLAKRSSRGRPEK